MCIFQLISALLLFNPLIVRGEDEGIHAPRGVAPQSEGQDYDVPRPPPGAPQSDAPLTTSPAQPKPDAAPGPGDQTLPSSPAVKMGWASTAASLILYGPAGDVSQEIGLKAWDERPGGNRIRRHTLRGGCSADGQFAWSWEKIENFPSGQIEKAAEESRTMRYFGTDGGELWRDSQIDAAPGFDPVAISSTGESLVISEHFKTEWAGALVTYAGDRLVEARGKGPIETVMITPRGRFGLVSFHPLDQPLTYTLLDAKKRKAISLPMDQIPPMRLSITDEGKVLAGPNIVYDARAVNEGPRR